MSLTLISFSICLFEFILCIALLQFSVKNFLFMFIFYVVFLLVFKVKLQTWVCMYYLWFQDSSDMKILNSIDEPEDDSDVLIECKDVFKSFGEKHILRGVSFKVKIYLLHMLCPCRWRVKVLTMLDLWRLSIFILEMFLDLYICL